MDRFEWDPAKAAANVVMHEIDFLEATEVFGDPHLVVQDSFRPEFGEPRWKAVGLAGERVIAVIFTIRDGRYRLISARKARANERRDYRQGHPFA